jgi:hypothetical protein
VSVQSDLASIRKLARKAPANSTLKRVVEECVAVMPKVNQYVPQNSSGYAVAFYDTNTGLPRYYTVNYQPGNTGNLVHELTHVVVNEAYGQDFVNFPSSQTPATAPQYDGMGRCSNESVRQDEWKRGGDGSRLGILQTLVGQARALDLGTRKVTQTFTDSSGKSTSLKAAVSQTQEVVDKLNYGISKPHIEFDTVVNQILVWFTEWGYPKKGGANNGFYWEIETAAKIAWHQRQAGR